MRSWKNILLCSLDCLWVRTFKQLKQYTCCLFILMVYNQVMLRRNLLYCCYISLQCLLVSASEIVFFPVVTHFVTIFFGGKSNAQNVISCFQALYVNPLDCYNIHWPIRRGQLNLHAGPGGSLTAVLADLEVIWSHAIQKYLEIPLKDLKVSCEQHIYVVWAVSTSLSVIVKEEQLAVIGSLLLVLFLIPSFCW